MEIKKVVTISVEDINGRELKNGQRFWYTKTNDTELYYGEFEGLNARNNIVIKNPITGSVTSVMPKSIENIYASMPDIED